MATSVLTLVGVNWFRLPGLSPTVGAIVWVGMVILTIALVVLSWTRLGQAKPLTKCLVLSVFAHLLLMIYAYGTRMLAPEGPIGPEQEFQVTLVMEHELPVTEQQSEVEPSAEEESPSDPVEVAQPDQGLVEESPEIPPEGLFPEVVEVAPEEEPAEPEETVVTQPDVVVESDPEEDPLLNEVETDSLEPEEVTVADPGTQQAEEPASENLPPLPVEIIELEAPTQFAGVEIPGPDETLDPEPLIPVPPLQRKGDGKELSPLYQQRFSASRVEAGRQFGLSDESEAAVRAALAWLARNQSEDGRWDTDRLEGGREAHVYGHSRNGAGIDADTGITALSLLAFMAAGHTHMEGAYRQNVQHGLEYLLGSQSGSGSLAGSARLYARMYCHGMALLAVSEAYALTGDPRILPFLERGLEFSIATQDPVGGGWRYQPGDPGDMSQFGWQVMALASAEKAGLVIPAATKKGMEKFLLSCCSGSEKGHAGYRPGSRPSVTMTAEALACRGWLGMSDPAAARQATMFLGQELPGEGRTNVYYWYYGTLALHRLQGQDWSRWNRAMQASLIPLQRHEGDLEGSWDPVTVWGPYGGRAYTTAMAALCLEVYYRYLPLEK
ncbi:MAG: hypothetical protein VB855_06915 [Pirellulaceae bacterium]